VEPRLINVGISDLKVGGADVLLRTVLGSCVGVCLYDKYNLIGGLAHMLLAKGKENESAPEKYVDTAIPLLIKVMTEHGANPKYLTAKIAGGAQMFAFSHMPIISEIGVNNIQRAKEVLHDLNIKIIAEDVGGDHGRTIDFFIRDGIVKVKSLGKPERIL